MLYLSGDVFMKNFTSKIYVKGMIEGTNKDTEFTLLFLQQQQKKYILQQFYKTNGFKIDNYIEGKEFDKFPRLDNDLLKKENITLKYYVPNEENFYIYKTTNDDEYLNYSALRIPKYETMQRSLSKGLLKINIDFKICDEFEFVNRIFTLNEIIENKKENDIFDCKIKIEQYFEK